MNKYYTCIDKAFELMREIETHVEENFVVIDRECKKQNPNIDLLKRLSRSNNDMINACALINAVLENCLSDDYVFIKMIMYASKGISLEDIDEEYTLTESDELEQACKIIDYSTKSVIAKQAKTTRAN